MWCAFVIVVGVMLSPTASAVPTVALSNATANIPPHTAVDASWSWPNPPAYSNTVKDVGSFSSAKACQHACMGYRNPDVRATDVSGWLRCQSFTFVAETGKCIVVVDPEEWSPTKDKGAVAGRLTWPPRQCEAADDCSYNGECVARRHGGGSIGSRLCRCRAGWGGDRCQTLALVPGSRAAGLRSVDGGQNTSSWGGSVLIDNTTGLLHMWASEIEGHCGIGKWTTNSHIVHAVSTTPYGTTFNRAATAHNKRAEVWPAFSHEVNVNRAPDGTWVMFFTAIAGGIMPAPCQACVDGNTPADVNSSVCPHHYNGTMATFMSTASSPDGPWSPPARLFPDHAQSDTNLAVTILANGSVVGLARTVVDAPLVVAIHPVTAHDWRDPASYVAHWNTTLFPDATWGPEDPMVYVDVNGVYHAVFHNQFANDDQRLCGGHAWSLDGWQWTLTGTAWGNTVVFLDEVAGESSVGDGSNVKTSSYSFSRRERPHLVFADPTDPFTITALTSGVQFGAHSPISVSGEDACYTLLQPVSTVRVL